MPPEPALVDLHRATVLPEWTDYNGHMNLAYYLLAFDHATDDFFGVLDVGHAYRLRAGHSLFTLEAHVTYERELNAGDPLRVTTQLLDADAKRLRYFHRMYHAEAGFLAATNELLSIHVNLSTRRAAPFPQEAAARIGALLAEHRKLPFPAQAGRTIAMRRPARAPSAPAASEA
jgi:acyl-CoA thioester hydrolase